MVEDGRGANPGTGRDTAPEVRSKADTEAHREAATEVWGTLYRLFFEGEGQRRHHQACDATGLAPGVLKTLLQLEPGRPVPMRDLAGMFRCDPSYMTSLVDGLEEAGLAERQLHPTDRRIRVVTLTERGRHTQMEARKILSEPPESLRSLTTTELRQLGDLLGKLLSEPERPAQETPAHSSSPSPQPHHLET
jgi:DNA-binding MarR family transcriptional regulator